MSDYNLEQPHALPYVPTETGLSMPSGNRISSSELVRRTTCPVCGYPDAHLMSDGSGVLCIPTCGYMSWRRIEELTRPSSPNASNSATGD